MRFNGGHLETLDHEADPEDRWCRTRYKLYRPYPFYAVLTTIVYSSERRLQSLTSLPMCTPKMCNDTAADTTLPLRNFDFSKCCTINRSRLCPRPPHGRYTAALPARGLPLHSSPLHEFNSPACPPDRKHLCHYAVHYQ